MEPASWQVLLGIVVLPLVTLIGYWWTRRGGRESHEIEERRVEIDGLKAAVETMQTALTSVRQDVTDLRTEVADVRCELAAEREHSDALTAHIWAGKPPPPPARRPRGLPNTTPEGHG